MPQVKLGDVAVESRETYKGDKTGVPIVGLEHLTPGEVTLSNWDTDTDNTFTKRFRKGDMLFGRRRAYLKKAAQAPFDGICSGDITVIRAKENQLRPELLPFIIQNDALFDFAVGKSAGSLSPRVKWDNLKNYTFELPTMNEQKKLAEVLWSINNTLQAYQNLLTQTDALVQAQFVEMFGNIRADKYRRMEEVCTLITDGTHNPPKFVDAGVPFLLVSNLTTNVLTYETKKYITEESYDILMKRTPIEIGDVLLSTVGSYGHPAIVTSDKKFAFQRHIAQLKPIRDVLDSQFLHAAILSKEVQNQIEVFVLGVAQKTLNLSAIKNIKIPIPSIEDQKIFASFVEQIDKSKSALQNTITSLQATKRCILETALGNRGKE